MEGLKEGFDILVYQSEDCETLAQYLSLFEFAPIIVGVDDLLAKAASKKYDLCIIDYREGIPGDLSLLESLRGLYSDTPIIFLANKLPGNTKNYEYTIAAFKAGVDDFILRPYNMDELVCRVRAILRRYKKVIAAPGIYNIGEYTFDTKSRSLRYHEIVKRLSPAQSTTLGVLCVYLNENVPKSLIIKELYADVGNAERAQKADRCLSVYLTELRKALRLDPRIRIISDRTYITLQVVASTDSVEDLF